MIQDQLEKFQTSMSLVSEEQENKLDPNATDSATVEALQTLILHSLLNSAHQVPDDPLALSLPNGGNSGN